jgi:hypothetical protein
VRILENARRLSLLEVLLALIVGGFAAFLSSFVLFGMSKVWFVLVIGAICVGIACMITGDLVRLWLHYFFTVSGVGLALTLVGRVEIGRMGLKLGGAGIDPLVDGG